MTSQEHTSSTSSIYEVLRSEFKMLQRIASHFSLYALQGAFFFAVCGAGALGVKAEPRHVSSESISHDGFLVNVGPTNSDGRCRIEVNYGKLLPKKVEHFSLPDPSRIVVDFEGIKTKGTKKFPITAAKTCVSTIRFGVHPTSTRIVFDLVEDRYLSYGNLSYEIAQVGNALVFNPELGKHEAMSAKPNGAAKIEIPPPPTATPSATPTTKVPPTNIPSTATPTHTVEAVSTVAATVAAEPTPEEPTATASPVPTHTPMKTSTATPTVTPTEDPGDEDVRSDFDEVDYSGTTKDVASNVIDTPEGRVFRHDVRPDLKFQVDQVLVELEPANPSVKNLLVTNVGEHELHMTARAVALVNPGTEDEEEIKTDQILVSPLLFDLKPKEQRRVRIVGLLAPPDIEQTFRVHLVPLHDDFDTTINMKLHGVEARLNIITALAVTVLRLPAEPHPQLKEILSPGKLVLANVGNQHVSLSEIKLCAKAVGSGCRELPDRRIFPGNSWEIDLPHTAKLQMLQKLGSEFQPLRVEGVN